MKNENSHLKLPGIVCLSVGIVIGFLGVILTYVLHVSGASVILLPNIVFGFVSGMFILAGTVLLVVYAVAKRLKKQ